MTGNAWEKWSASALLPCGAAPAGAIARVWRRASAQIAFARAMKSWLLVLLDGRLVADASPRELLERPPTVEVARFLGFDGTLSLPGGDFLLARAQHVVLDPAGPLRARVTRAIPLEDGVRLEMTLDNGKLYAVSPLPGPVRGQEVGVRVTGGVGFREGPAAESHDAVATRLPAR
jgi:hypothetical protein